jgi:predicted DNA-binding transcriptional regulator AlpA
MPKESFKDLTPSDALKHFDLLPSAALVRQPVVEALFSCSGATIRRRVADGRIPKPRRYSDRVAAWNVGELRAVLQGTVRP